MILTRSDRTDIEGLKDVVGMKIAFPGTNFLGGLAAQMLELSEAGIQLGGSTTLKQWGSHDAVMEAVRTQKADVGFLRTGLLEMMAKEGRLEIGEFKVLNPQKLADYPYLVSTRLYPEWPFVVLPHLDRQLVRRLASALFALEADHPAALAAGIAGFGPPADYLPVEQLTRELRLPPFDHPVEFTIGDLWRRHFGFIIASSILFVALVVSCIWLLVLARQARHNEELQRTLHRRLNDILAGTHVGTWEWNVQTGATVFNERWAEMLGYHLSELQPIDIKTWERLTHPEDLERCDQCLQEHFSGHRDYYEVEMRMRHKNRQIWLLDRGKVVSWTHDGQPLLMS